MLFPFPLREEVKDPLLRISSNKDESPASYLHHWVQGSPLPKEV